MKTAVNWQLLQGIIEMEQAFLYEVYCNQLRRVNHDLQRVELLSKRNRPTTTPYHQPSLYRGDSEQMDWESITAQLAAVNKQQNASHTTTRGPQWASEEELQVQRNQGRCLHCGSRGHFIQQCLEGPNQPNQVAAVGTTEQTQEVERTLEGEESKKE